MNCGSLFPAKPNLE